MPAIFGIPVTDAQIRQWNAADINGRVAILNLIGRPDLIDRAVVGWVEETYGYLGAILEVPEIRRLLITAGKEGWNPERIQGALSKTRWWKNHDAAQRSWLQIVSSDPAEAEKQIKAAQSTIRTILSVHGVADRMNANQIEALARRLLPMGVQAGDSQAMTRYVLAQVKFKPGPQSGVLGQGMNEIKSRANQYLVPVGDRGAFKYAQRIAMGQDTMEGVDAHFRNLAKARWSHLAEQLDKGYTVRDLIEPNINRAAELLEIDPEAIDPTDPRFSAIVDLVDPSTSTHRTQSISETERMVRGMAEYKATAGAQAQAAALGNTLLKTFGKVG